MIAVMAKKRVKPESALAKNLRALQAKLGYTHAQLAKEIGVALITLRKWLYGHSFPAKPTLNLIHSLCQQNGIKIKE